ncbi:MAG: hypothetical protein ACLUCR_05645 [Limosilactobacillus fermentum]|nr:hypothetical protein [Limosilactobacillus fermentum]MDU2967213.1 hypothetical protein [Limosilactobacillus fermentum]
MSDRCKYNTSFIGNQHRFKHRKYGELNTPTGQDVTTPPKQQLV